MSIEDEIRRALERKPVRRDMRGHRSSGPLKTRKITAKEFTRACGGSWGVKAQIARVLGVSRNRIDNLLTRQGPDWDQARLAFQQELDRTCDLAERTVRHCIKQRGDLNVSLRAAIFHLEKRNRKLYGDSKTVILEGGSEPVKIETRRTLSPDVIEKMPVEAQRALLEALDADERPADV